MPGPPSARDSLLNHLSDLAACPRTFCPRRDLAELASSSQAAGLAATLQRTTPTLTSLWVQVYGLSLLAGHGLGVLAAGALAEQQRRAERLGERALRQLLRWPLELLGPCTEALRHGALILRECPRAYLAFTLPYMSLPHYALMRVVGRHLPALSRCAPLLSSTAHRPARVRFLAAVVHLLVTMRATRGEYATVL